MNNALRNDEIALLMDEKIRLILGPVPPGLDEGEILDRVHAIEARLRALGAYGNIT